MQNLEVMDYSKSIYLKKCSNCGSEAEAVYGLNGCYIHCVACGARTCAHSKIKHAQDQWNTRKLLIFEE